jgi:hypothetical protein
VLSAQIQAGLIFDLTRGACLFREVPMIVDVHAHYFPKAYTDLLLRIGGRSLPEAARPRTARPMREDDPAGIQARLQQMDEAEVQMQVLSPAASPPYADKEADAVEAALLCAWKAFGADHLVAGSDYPVLLAFETYRQTFHYIREAVLPAEDVDKILNHNAQMLLGLAH